MSKTTYSLCIRRISYSDENVGNDFQFNVHSEQGKASFNTKVSHGKTREYKRVKKILRNISHDSAQKIKIRLKTEVTEKDTREKLDDYGESIDNITLPPVRGVYIFQVPVPVFGDPIGDWNKKYKRPKRGLLLVDYEVEVKVPHPKLIPGERIPIPERIIPGIPDKKNNDPILAFMSDLHIGDGTVTDDFDDFDDKNFIQALDWLESIGKGVSRPIYLTLLGDFLELWETDAKATITTTSANGETTSHERAHYDVDDPIEIKLDIAKAKVDRVVEAHNAVMARLASWSNVSNHELYIIIGNHDDDFVSAQVEKHFLAKSFDGKKITLTNSMRFFQAFPVYHVWAEHGHKFDDFNLASQFGAKPNGRYVVEDLSTAIESLEVFKDLDPHNRLPKIKNPFNKFDSVATYDAYINCLRTKGYFHSDSSVIKEIGEIIDAIAANQDIDPVSGDPQLIQKVKNAITKFGLDVVDRILRFSPLERIQFILKKIEESRTDNPPSTEDAKSRLSSEVQCVVMGHNHSPEMTAIGPDQRYVNTGNWQDSGVADPSSPDCFRLEEHRNLFLIYKDAKQFAHSGGTLVPQTVRVDHYTFPNAKLTDKMFYNLKD